METFDLRIKSFSVLADESGGIEIAVAIAGVGAGARSYRTEPAPKASGFLFFFRRDGKRLRFDQEYGGIIFHRTGFVAIQFRYALIGFFEAGFGKGREIDLVGRDRCLQGFQLRELIVGKAVVFDEQRRSFEVTERIAVQVVDLVPGIPDFIGKSR